MAIALLDEIEPTWHVREYHETIVNAPSHVVYAELAVLPANASTVMRVLMGLRRLPARLMGKRSEVRVIEQSLIKAMQQQGFALLGERPGEEIVLGLAGRFWQAAPSASVYK